MTGDDQTPLDPPVTHTPQPDLRKEDLLSFLNDFRAASAAPARERTDAAGGVRSAPKRALYSAVVSEEATPELDNLDSSGRIPPVVLATDAEAPYNPNPDPEWQQLGPSQQPEAAALQTDWPAPLAQPFWPAPSPMAPPPPPGYSYPAPMPPQSNTIAGVALGLGLGSLLVPILSIPGLVLGIKALRRIKRQPWIGGRGRAIAGIVTSLLLGPLVAVGLTVAIVNKARHEDMSRVQSLVSSTVRTQVQQQTGSAPNVSVTCPSSEPRRAGTTFSCLVTDTDTGRSVTVQVRETDNAGDFFVSAEPSTSE